MVPPGEKVADDRDDEEGARPAPVMLPTTPEQAAAAERAAAERAAGEDDAALTPDRMKELKEKARSEIEQRLKDRRKKRRLLRGGDASGHFSVS